MEICFHNFVTGDRPFGLLSTSSFLTTRVNRPPKSRALLLHSLAPGNQRRSLTVLAVGTRKIQCVAPSSSFKTFNERQPQCVSSKHRACLVTYHIKIYSKERGGAKLFVEPNCPSFLSVQAPIQLIKGTLVVGLSLRAC